MSVLTYLACPYSHDDPVVKARRFMAANEAAAKLMKGGHCVYSPISHSHPIAVQCGLPGTWEYWREVDETYLFLSKVVFVLRLDGWRESEGVTAEIRYAKATGIPVEYIDP
jgi:hypothetical protein